MTFKKCWWRSVHVHTHLPRRNESLPPFFVASVCLLKCVPNSNFQTIKTSNYIPWNELTIRCIWPPPKFNSFPFINFSVLMLYQRFALFLYHLFLMVIIVVYVKYTIIISPWYSLYNRPQHPCHDICLSSKAGFKHAMIGGEQSPQVGSGF